MIETELLQKMKTTEILFFCLLACTCFISDIAAYRILTSGELTPNGTYFKPLDQGFVGVYGDPLNKQRERINEGAFETSTQELLFEGSSPRQVCPGMVGPFSDGNFYCSAREYGYCDRRSGTCFCNIGYQGIDCSECQATHFMVGTLCHPKKLCEADCSGAGSCNFYNGTCSCLPHRQGRLCEIQLCSMFSPLCESCTANQCLRCAGGYYLTLESNVCSTCYDFDPRCAGCTKELGCTTCADPVLTSVRRSGYRASDPKQPIEEDTREFSITLPFGTKSPESFADAENFFVVKTKDETPLKNFSTTCSQGLSNDDHWHCQDYPASHRVCGHYGVFKFSYPNYVIPESAGSIRLSVERSGGGYGDVTISYFVKHFTTNDSDVTATAPYTTSQVLSFEAGIVQRTFLINIMDDNIVEENEVFQVVLETPVGGGSIGAQFRTNVTIVDNDVHQLAAPLTKHQQTHVQARANEPFSVSIQARLPTGDAMKSGGARFLSLIENDQQIWSHPNTSSGSQRQARRMQCSVVDNGDGTYTSSATIREQGNYQLRTYHAFPGGLRGQYYSDAFFETLALERIDKHVNFTWGTGRLIPRGSDYISIRWTGAIIPNTTDYYSFKVEAQDLARLWINGDLILDHFHQQAANMEPPRSIYLRRGRLAEIVLEYRKIRGEAHARLTWSYGTLSKHVIPSSVLYSLYDIGLNPVIVNVRSGETSPNATECTGEGLFAGESLQPSHFQVCPRDRFGNMRDDDDLGYLSTELFRAKLTLLEYATGVPRYHGVGAEELIPTLSYDSKVHCFRGTYTPQRAGRYQLDIKYKYWHNQTSYPVVGSPFIVDVKPTKTSGPYSEVFDLPSPLYLQAGKCDNFTIIARDFSRNLVLRGGDDISVYMYQIDHYSVTAGTPVSVQGIPTRAPTAAPTFVPTTLLASTSFTSSPDWETMQAIVRDGWVVDHLNGNYTAKICPVIAGWYEVHVLLKGQGVSNQPFRLHDKKHSLSDVTMGTGSYRGDYIDRSPYSLVVSHGFASGVTSTVTAGGAGLVGATVGIPVSFMLTVRDAWDNVLRTSSPSCKVSVLLNRSPNATVSIWNYGNGSYNIEYTPVVSGINMITVKVDGMQIPGSPFSVPTLDGKTSQSYSYFRLHGGTAGVTLYFELFSFDLQGNRKTIPGDDYSFIVHGANNISFTPLFACPTDALLAKSHPACDAHDLFAGHYFGFFTPLYAGDIVVEVFLTDSSGVRHSVSNSPQVTKIVEGYAFAENSAVGGVLYDNVAGVDAWVTFQLFDSWMNRITTGGAGIELALLGVAVEWGTIQPWGTTPGAQDNFHYRGFYSGFPNYYGLVTDHLDGSYAVQFNAKKAGKYVMRLSLLQPGLNATYFNDSSFGHLFDNDFNLPGYIASQDGVASNFGKAIYWTGDIIVQANPITGKGTYRGMFDSRVENSVAFNISYSPAIGEGSETAFPLQGKQKFREQYWSVRYTGAIVPEFAETYIFSVVMDPTSSLKLYVGGVGTAINGSTPGDLVLNLSFQATGSGSYTFSDAALREFVLEYSHGSGNSFLDLYWESPTTGKQIIPPSAFFHWRNISHYNTTIHPAPLCSSCSTSFGADRFAATVGHMHSFLVYARDEFGNLLQTGGDVPTMFAVGRDGVAFRGEITDYGNSTYLVEYYPTVAGEFQMYVSVGCCAPSWSVGYPAEISGIRPLLIQSAPFTLVVKSDLVDASRSIVIGKGVLGGSAGELLTVQINYRDLHNNPASIAPVESMIAFVQFVDISTGKLVRPAMMSFTAAFNNLIINYNLTKATTYVMSIKLSLFNESNSEFVFRNQSVNGSPFRVVITPEKAHPSNTVCRGLGLRNAVIGKTASFEVQLFDRFLNALQVGGAKLFTRVVGDSSVMGGGDTVEIPVCSDLQNGKYSCLYNVTASGKHHLVVRILNYSTSVAGGLGLTGSFYSSPTFEISVSDSSSTLLYTEINPSISFSWPNGLQFALADVLGGAMYQEELIAPETKGGRQVMPMVGVGQSVRWQGYLWAPFSDSFQLGCHLTNLNASIFIDSNLVFDSYSKYSRTVYLQGSSAYEIKILVQQQYQDVDRQVVTNSPSDVSLYWTSLNSPTKAPISSFYLYDSSLDIAMSPFVVLVN